MIRAVFVEDSYLMKRVNVLQIFVTKIGLMRKTIRKDGQYSDGSECAAYICKSCFSRANNEKIMRTLWKGHEYAKKIRKQRGEE